MSFIEYESVTRRFRSLTAVDRLSFSLQEGETVGLVGESGSGKSTAVNMLVKMQPITDGRILYEGMDISKLRKRELHRFRRDVQMVFQDTGAALDPHMNVASIISEPMLNHHAYGRTEMRARICELLEMVSLDPTIANRYPRELSGGQRQRVAIARALATQPRLIILDEATAGLDVSVQAQILNLLKQLRVKTNMAYLVISHDLGVIQYLCDRIIIMYQGRMVEEIPSENLLNVQHPYSRMLLESLPSIEKKNNLKPIASWSEDRKSSGCPFAQRCAEREDRCYTEEPSVHCLSADHRLVCHHR